FRTHGNDLKNRSVLAINFHSIIEHLFKFSALLSIEGIGEFAIKFSVGLTTCCLGIFRELPSVTTSSFRPIGEELILVSDHLGIGEHLGNQFRLASGRSQKARNSFSHLLEGAKCPLLCIC